MGFIVRCPLIGIPCGKTINIQEKTFFLAEAEKPEDNRSRRGEAIRMALGDEYTLKSALDEREVYAFTCKICELIQTCAYGIADITDSNPNVVLELGMMISLGKPTVILKKRGEVGLNLPSDLNAIEIILFTEYIDIIKPLRKVASKLPPPVTPTSPMQDLEKILPQVAEETRKELGKVVQEFTLNIQQAKLDTVRHPEEKKAVSPKLSKRIARLEEKLQEMDRLGFVTDAETALYRGNYYHELGEYNKALAYYDRSLQLRPDHPSTLNGRGATYAHIGRYKEALADLNRSFQINPDNPEILAIRGTIYAVMQSYDQCLADCTRSLELRPDDPVTLNNRGGAYFELKRYKEALADYNRSLELKPDDPYTLYNRGLTYAKLERYDEALADFNRSLELKPDDPGTFYNLACLYSLQNKADDALIYLEKAIKGDEKYRQMTKDDKDFDNIRADPRFKKIIESS